MGGSDMEPCPDGGYWYIYDARKAYIKDLEDAQKVERRACYGKAADALLGLLNAHWLEGSVDANSVAKLMEEFKALAHK